MLITTLRIGHGALCSDVRLAATFDRFPYRSDHSPKQYR